MGVAGRWWPWRVSNGGVRGPEKGSILLGTTAARPHRLAALQLANDVRQRRAKLRRQLRLGTVSAAEVLLDPPREAASWPISALLMSQRQWGRVRSEKLLARNKINEAKALGDLTERQRRLLVDQLQPPSITGKPAAQNGGLFAHAD